MLCRGWERVLCVQIWVGIMFRRGFCEVRFAAVCGCPLATVHPGITQCRFYEHYIMYYLSIRLYGLHVTVRTAHPDTPYLNLHKQLGQRTEWRTPGVDVPQRMLHHSFLFRADIHTCKFLVWAARTGSRVLQVLFPYPCLSVSPSRTFPPHSVSAFSIHSIATHARTSHEQK